MGEYFTREEAVKLCLSFQHLIQREFTNPKSRIKYSVDFIVPAPANRELLDEFRELINTFYNMGDNTELRIFDSKLTEDEFIPFLFARGILTRGANLLAIPMRHFVDQTGQMRNGFQVHPQSILF